MKKNVLFVLTSLLILTLLVFVGTGTTGMTGVADNSEEQRGVISVYGEAEISAEPDFARVHLGVETTRENVEEAVRENADKMESVMEALKDSGVDEDNIETGTYRVSQYREHVSDRDYKDMYRVSNQLDIVLLNTENVGSIIDIAVGAGSNRVHSINFELEDREDIKLEALQLATKQARIKGDAIAESAETRIENIKLIKEEASSYSPYRTLYGMESKDIMMAEDSAETPIVPGNIKVKARVVAEYFLVK